MALCIYSYPPLIRPKPHRAKMHPNQSRTTPGQNPNKTPAFFGTCVNMCQCVSMCVNVCQYVSIGVKCFDTSKKLFSFTGY